MIITEDLKISKWLVISFYNWSDFINSRITEIVSNEYSCLEFLDFEDIIKFDILVMKKFEFKYFVILYILLDIHFQSIISDT